MGSEFNTVALLSEWSSYVDNYLKNSKSFAFGIFTYKDNLSESFTGYLYMNKGLRTVLGIDDDETGTNPLNRFINPDFQTLIDIAEAEGEGVIFRGILTTGDQSDSRSVEATIFSKNKMLLVFCEYDISELDRLNSEMLDLNQELNNVQRQLIKEKKLLTKALADLKNAQSKLIESEKMASLGRLVAGFAHEINTPIGIALTASSSITDARNSIENMLACEEVEEEELIAALDTIKDSEPLVINNIRRAADLVGSFKRTAIDQSIDDFHIYNLHDIIKDVVISAGSQFKKTDININIDCPNEIELYGNPNDISQLLLNLLLNSLVHGFCNGDLKGNIFIKVCREDDNIIISYSDTGKGMDSETVKKIFEPFFTTARAKGGTGLGMYICHNIVTNRLHGTIKCESSQGRGADFFISFPIPNKTANSKG